MLFAEYMVIWGNSPSDIQQRLNSSSEYCSEWGLQVNAVKSKNLVFRKRGGLRPDEVWQYNRNVIETVSIFNNLFYYTGSFTLSYERLSGKGL